MIDLYTWGTPNGQKVSIALEELALEYEVKPIDITAGAQHDPAFRVIAPNGRIPAIVDRDTGISLFESGAILIYLAEKAAQLLPASGQERAAALSWTFWQMAGLGPMIGQWGHFVRAEEKIDYAIERYLSESLRLFDVLEKRLAESPFLAGPAYSIADIACFPWVRGGLMYITNLAPDRVPSLPHTDRWAAQIGDRPAVQRGLAVPATTAD